MFFIPLRSFPGDGIAWCQDLWYNLGSWRFGGGLWQWMGPWLLAGQKQLGQFLGWEWLCETGARRRRLFAIPSCFYKGKVVVLITSLLILVMDVMAILNLLSMLELTTYRFFHHSIRFSALPVPFQCHLVMRQERCWWVRDQIGGILSDRRRWPITFTTFTTIATTYQGSLWTATMSGRWGTPQRCGKR